MDREIAKLILQRTNYTEIEKNRIINILLDQDLDASTAAARLGWSEMLVTNSRKMLRETANCMNIAQAPLAAIARCLQTTPIAPAMSHDAEQYWTRFVHDNFHENVQDLQHVMGSTEYELMQMHTFKSDDLTFLLGILQVHPYVLQSQLGYRMSSSTIATVEYVCTNTETNSCVYTCLREVQVASFMSFNTDAFASLTRFYRENHSEDDLLQKLKEIRDSLENLLDS